MVNFWDFSVWGWLILIAILLGSLLVANALKKNIPLLQDSLIPTSVLGGAILLAITAVFRLTTKEPFFDGILFNGNGAANLEVLTYHTLALGFIASALKTSDQKTTKKRALEIFDSGVTTVATYLLQAVVGFGITMIAALVMEDFFPAAGMLLPFGYGQGTGQALNYGGIYEAEYGFVGGRSFGLTIAALGFLSASIGGVVHLTLLKRRGKITGNKSTEIALRSEDIESSNEIPMQESIDKMTIQIALIIVAYVLAFFMMYGLSALLPGMRSVIYGFNFLLGVIAATIIKLVIKLLKKANIVKKEYINNFLLTRACNFFFDLMVVAGIAAIRIDMLKRYWGIILIVGIVGLIITYAYTRIVATTLFKEYAEEQFLATYGMLTGTASTGIILLREIDGDFKTPAADNMVYQTLPAIVFGFPLMLLATLAPEKPVLSLIIMFAFFIVMNIILFRSFILGKLKRK